MRGLVASRVFPCPLLRLRVRTPCIPSCLSLVATRTPRPRVWPMSLVLLALLLLLLLSVISYPLLISIP